MTQDEILDCRLIKTLLLAFLFALVACENGLGVQKEETPSPSPSGSSASATDGNPVIGEGSPTKTAAESTKQAESLDPIQECVQQCRESCEVAQLDKNTYYERQRQQIADAPFDVEIERVFLKGNCHQGDDPARRKNAAGISAVVEGQITYRGEDIIYRATPTGNLVLHIGPKRFVESPTHANSQFEHRVRGSNPWFFGQTRRFHWESEPINPVYCEVTPNAIQAFIQLETQSVERGAQEFPIHFVELAWDEVVGMALRQEVKFITTVNNTTKTEPADAHYSRRDRILITRLTGATEWVKRTSILQNGNLNRGPEAIFPSEVSNGSWTVKVKGISQSKEYGGYAPRGEDQFLAVLEVEIAYHPKNTENPDPVPLKNMQLRLETADGKWQKPTPKASGQINMSTKINPGATYTGSLVFPKQRFERPFRLEVKTPDKSVMYIDVFSYRLGPERTL